LTFSDVSLCQEDVYLSTSTCIQSNIHQYVHNFGQEFSALIDTIQNEGQGY
jgi:hypothetical protein